MEPSNDMTEPSPSTSNLSTNDLVSLNREKDPERTPA